MMQFTLFGYPKSGKTTLFNLLTGAGIEIKAYENQKKEPHLRTATVPDERLDAISGLYPDKEKKPAVIEFIDMAGTAFGEIKNSAYLNHLRIADGLVHVARGFHNEQLPHPKGSVDASRDSSFMEEELVFADLVSVETRLEKLTKELARNKSPEGEKEKAFLEILLNHLENGKPLRGIDLNPNQEKQVKHFAFLSRKPLLHAINVDEKDISLIENPEQLYSSDDGKTAVFGFCGRIESEIMELDEEEKQLFLQEYGLIRESAPRFLRAAYDLLKVITFYTIGDKEVKAWSIRQGTTALNAAGAIHSDIEKGFIKAEITPALELIKYGSIPSARENAAIHLEGKDYVVQDGDIIYFRFSK